MGIERSTYQVGTLVFELLSVFGIDGVKITIISNEEKEKQGRVDYKHGFDVSAIYPPSIFWHDIDKLADWWSNYKEEDKPKELEETVNMG